MPKPPFRRAGLLAILAIVLAVAAAEAFFTIAGPSVATRLRIDMQPVSAILADQDVRVAQLRTDEQSLLLLDSTLGWRYRGGYAEPGLRMNEVGLRSDREYEMGRTKGVRRIAVFGDAYAFGAEVENHETWPARMEAANEGTEVLNYAVGGYGTDQALLYFLRDGMRYMPDIVLIGFTPVSVVRSVVVYPRFISAMEAPPAKPRFDLDSGGALMLRPNPLATPAAWDRLEREPLAVVRELGVHDAWYQPFKYENPLHDRSATMRFAVAAGTRVWRKCCWSERPFSDGVLREGTSAFAVQRATMLAFADSVRARGARPVFVMLPDLETVHQVRDGHTTSYAPLRAALEADGRAPVIDLADAFAAPAEAGAWFAAGGHYTSTATALIAEWVARHLAQLEDA